MKHLLVTTLLLTLARSAVAPGFSKSNLLINPSKCLACVQQKYFFC